MCKSLISKKNQVQSVKVGLKEFMMYETTRAMTGFSRSEVQAYISLLDNIITRMASNSANAKNWLMTIIAAAIALQWSHSQLSNVIWLLVPTILFAFTDLYYLGMERHFKKVESDFIAAIRNNPEATEGLFVFRKTSKKEQIVNTFKAIDSLSIWPFYGIVIAGILVVYFYNTTCCCF